MKEQHDEDLILFMACREEEPETAREAFLAFYDRHYQQLFRWIYRKFVINSQLTSEDAEEILVDAFRDLYFKKAQKYESPGGTAEQRTRNVKAWFMRIVTNDFYQYFRDQQPVYKNVVSLETVRFDLADIENDFELTDYERNVQFMVEVLDSLNDKDRQIAMTIQEVVDIETGKQRRMSPQELEIIAANIETSPANIRQRRKRLIALIKAKFSDSEIQKLRVVKGG